MFSSIRIGDRDVGDNCPVYIIAEIGVNHNGDPNILCELLQVAHEAQCDAVKFQKRTVDVVYSREELAKPRETPFGKTNGDLKRHLELAESHYTYIASSCAR